MKRKRIIIFSALLALSLISCPPADATLGGRADTVDADGRALQGVHRAATSHRGYTVQEVVADASTVREYLTPSGVVFGIAWNGNIHPDLEQLLGSYWGEYSAVRDAAGRKPGRRGRQVKTDNVVVEKWGHMRNLRGRAYLPSLVPTGVTSDEIK